MEHYYEKNLIINNRQLLHKGIFRVEDLFQTINKSLQERGYEKREKKSEELVTEEGRRTFVELRPFKVKANYAMFMIAMRILLNNITETVQEVHGERRKFQRGDVTITFDSWVLTDYQQRWVMKPVVYFLKGMINKYLYKFPLEAGLPQELAGDTAHVYAEVKKLFASYVDTEGKRVVSEKEVLKSIEAEMKKENVEV